LPTFIADKQDFIGIFKVL